MSHIFPIKLDMEMLTSEEKYNIYSAADVLKTILDAFITDRTTDQTEKKEQLLTAAEKKSSIPATWKKEEQLLINQEY